MRITIRFVGKLKSQNLFPISYVIEEKINQIPCNTQNYNNHRKIIITRNNKTLEFKIKIVADSEWIK